MSTKHTDEDFKKLAEEHNVLYAAFQQTKKELKELQGDMVYLQKVDMTFLKGLEALQVNRAFNIAKGETTELC